MCVLNGDKLSVATLRTLNPKTCRYKEDDLISRLNCFLSYSYIYHIFRLLLILYHTQLSLLIFFHLLLSTPKMVA